MNPQDASPTFLLSVIVLLPTEYESRRAAIAELARQTIRQQIELVLVAPQNLALALDPAELKSFGAWNLVRIEHFSSPGQATAEGVRSAQAPLVTYLEEHAFPAPTWAEAIVAAHQGAYAAVGNAMENGNPKTLCSWMNMYEEFGPIVAPAASHPTNYLGGHNTTYKRRVLLTYRERLGRLLDNESALHIDLRAQGYQLYLEGRAVSRHVNLSEPFAYFRQNFFGQRSFAALRAETGKWSLAKRALYVFAAPLIPLVRLRRIVREIARTGRTAQLLPRGLIFLVPALCAGTLGEVTGYLFGDSAGNIRRKAQAELYRSDYVASSDRQNDTAP